MRLAVVEFHKLKAIVVEGHREISPYEQAKQLFIRLAFGGTYNSWKTDYAVVRNESSMDDIVVFERELTLVATEVYNANPVMVANLSKNVEWESKSVPAKKRSTLALYCQTIESLLQQNCVREVVAKYGLRLEFIVPSQDGFMVTVDEFDKRVGRDNLGDMLTCCVS